MKTLWLIVLAMLLALAYYEFEYDQEITHAPGILIHNAPQQVGYLISIRGEDGWHWRSSLSRTDSGDGACEVVWVDSLAIRY